MTQRRGVIVIIVGLRRERSPRVGWLPLPSQTFHELCYLLTKVLRDLFWGEIAFWDSRRFLFRLSEINSS
jgi:hypothetical protein